MNVIGGGGDGVDGGVAVVTPFPDVSMHVVEVVAIWEVLPDFFTGINDVAGAVPSVVSQGTSIIEGPADGAGVDVAKI